MDKNREVEIRTHEKHQYNLSNQKAIGKEITDLAEQSSAEANEGQADSPHIKCLPCILVLPYHPLHLTIQCIATSYARDPSKSMPVSTHAASQSSPHDTVGPAQHPSPQLRTAGL